MVAVPGGVDQGPWFLIAGRVVGLHAEVEPEEEIGEVEPQSGAVGEGELLVEFVEAEQSPRLCFIVADCPDVAGVDEQRPFEHPKKFRPVFNAEFQ